MCPFEILHFAPLGLIALSLIGFRSLNQQIFLNFALLVLSLVGLFAGAHMHTAPEHMEPFSLFDPCYGYIVSLLVSSFSFSKGAYSRLLQKNEA